MRNYLAILCASAVLICASSVARATVVTITGHYDLSETYSDVTNHTSSGGGPALIAVLGNNVVDTTTDANADLSLPLTVGGGWSAPVSFATFSPDNLRCEGPGCVGGYGGIETDPISLQFSFTAPVSAALNTTVASTKLLSVNGIFTAKYSGAPLACAAGDPAGKSDCINWVGSPYTVNFANGAVLGIKLNDAHDWAITPTVQFSLTAAPANTPEPASILIFGTSAMGLMWARRTGRKVSGR
jgi:PEP-CTERM motif